MGTKLVDRLEANRHSYAGSILSACTYNTTPLHVFLMHTLEPHKWQLDLSAV